MCSLFSHRLKIMAKNALTEPQPASASKVEAKMEEEKTFECGNNVAHNLVVLNSLHFFGGRIKFGTNGISLKKMYFSMLCKGFPSKTYVKRRLS